MSEVNQQAWEQLIDKDIEWISQSTPPTDKNSLEFLHIVDCLRWLRENKPIRDNNKKETESLVPLICPKCHRFHNPNVECEDATYPCSVCHKQIPALEIWYCTDHDQICKECLDKLHPPEPKSSPPREEIRCEDCGNMIWELEYCQFLRHRISNGYAMREHSKSCGGFVPVKEVFYEHLCDTCVHDFPTCGTHQMVWGIDRDPSAKGKKADTVVRCDGYVRSNPPAKEEVIASIVGLILVLLAIVILIIMGTRYAGTEDSIDPDHAAMMHRR